LLAPDALVQETELFVVNIKSVASPGGARLHDVH